MKLIFSVLSMILMLLSVIVLKFNETAACHIMLVSIWIKMDWESI